MSKDYQTLVNATTSAAADGDWIQPNQYSSGMNFINTAAVLGDTYLEVSPDESTTVSVALPLGISRLEGVYPKIRARKIADANAGAVFLSQTKR